MLFGMLQFRQSRQVSQQVKSSQVSQQVSQVKTVNKSVKSRQVQVSQQVSLWSSPPSCYDVVMCQPKPYSPFYPDSNAIKTVRLISPVCVGYGGSYREFSSLST